MRKKKTTKEKTLKINSEVSTEYVFWTHMLILQKRQGQLGVGLFSFHVSEYSLNNLKGN